MTTLEKAQAVAEMRNRPEDGALVIQISRHTWDCCLDVADGYVAICQPEDNEPVTVEWLKYIGFGHDVNDREAEVMYMSASSPAVLYNPLENRWSWEDEAGDVSTLPAQPTRGHVRRLLTVFGIPLHQKNDAPTPTA